VRLADLTEPAGVDRVWVDSRCCKLLGEHFAALSGVLLGTFGAGDQRGSFVLLSSVSPAALAARFGLCEPVDVDGVAVLQLGADPLRCLRDVRVLVFPCSGCLPGSLDVGGLGPVPPFLAAGGRELGSRRGPFGVEPAAQFAGRVLALGLRVAELLFALADSRLADACSGAHREA
jgi:hypothetical protein